MTAAALTETLRPLAEQLQETALDDPKAACEAIEAKIPFLGELIVSIREAALEGSKAGWLHPREAGDVRFGRVAKDLCGFSVDAVLMDGPGPKHRHPKGEIDLCFATEGQATFDGLPEGWVVYGPDSVHIPTVKDGQMLILYFLPGGAMEFL